MNSERKLPSQIPIPLLYLRKEEASSPIQQHHPQPSPPELNAKKPNRRSSTLTVPSHRIVRVSVRPAGSFRLNKNSLLQANTPSQSTNLNLHSNENEKLHKNHAHSKQ